MPEHKINIPVIDLFAGPGGLGEGFSSLTSEKERVFDIQLSIEKDKNAHQTLELRSFTRQFENGNLPQEYYDLLKEPNLERRKKLRNQLFSIYPDQARTAQNEAWNAELGSSDFPSEFVDTRIRNALKGEKEWLLIGGPPCQAYSLVGRSRVGGIDEEDHRVYLYREYLRIIAKFHPSVFVMENVKGLLSAKVNGSKVFSWILNDLRNPSFVFPNLDAPRYKVYSLSTPHLSEGIFGTPQYANDLDYLIRSEDYNIPQRRHRVILLGVRDDIKIRPGILQSSPLRPTTKQVIGDLPKIRSGINREYSHFNLVDGEKKRKYKYVQDSSEKWQSLVTAFRKDILSMNGFIREYTDTEINAPENGIGSEFVPCDNTPSKSNPLYDWYYDPKLEGVSNHESRAHLVKDIKRYMFSSMFTKAQNRFPRLSDYLKYCPELLPDHENAKSGKFADRFRVQLPDQPATTVTSHISKDGHYFIHYDPDQCRSLTVREAARIQTFPDNYLFCGSRTAQFHQVGNAVPPFLAKQIAEIVFDLLKEL